MGRVKTGTVRAFRIQVEIGIESDSGGSSCWMSAWRGRSGLGLSLGLGHGGEPCPFLSGIQGMVTKPGALTGEPGCPTGPRTPTGPGGPWWREHSQKNTSSSRLGGHSR